MTAVGSILSLFSVVGTVVFKAGQGFVKYVKMNGIIDAHTEILTYMTSAATSYLAARGYSMSAAEFLRNMSLHLPTTDVSVYEEGSVMEIPILDIVDSSLRINKAVYSAISGANVGLTRYLRYYDSGTGNYNWGYNFIPEKKLTIAQLGKTYGYLWMLGRYAGYIPGFLPFLFKAIKSSGDSVEDELQIIMDELAEMSDADIEGTIANRLQTIERKIGLRLAF